MAEVVWPGTRMFTSLSGDKEVARSHKRDARILIGYLLGTTSDLRPYAYRTVRLADGSVVQAHVWRGDGVARAKVRIWSPSRELLEEVPLIYDLVLFIASNTAKYGYDDDFLPLSVSNTELCPVWEWTARNKLVRLPVRNNAWNVQVEKVEGVKTIFSLGKAMFYPEGGGSVGTAGSLRKDGTVLEDIPLPVYDFCIRTVEIDTAPTLVALVAKSITTNTASITIEFRSITTGELLDTATVIGLQNWGENQDTAYVKHVKFSESGNKLGVLVSQTGPGGPTLYGDFSNCAVFEANVAAIQPGSTIGTVLKKEPVFSDVVTDISTDTYWVTCSTGDYEIEYVTGFIGTGKYETPFMFNWDKEELIIYSLQVQRTVDYGYVAPPDNTYVSTPDRTLIWGCIPYPDGDYGVWVGWYQPAAIIRTQRSAADAAFVFLKVNDRTVASKQLLRYLDLTDGLGGGGGSGAISAPDLAGVSCAEVPDASNSTNWLDTYFVWCDTIFYYEFPELYVFAPPCTATAGIPPDWVKYGTSIVNDFWVSPHLCLGKEAGWIDGHGVTTDFYYDYVVEGMTPAGTGQEKTYTDEVFVNFAGKRLAIGQRSAKNVAVGILFSTVEQFKNTLKSMAASRFLSSSSDLTALTHLAGETDKKEPLTVVTANNPPNTTVRLGETIELEGGGALWHSLFGYPPGFPLDAQACYNGTLPDYYIGTIAKLTSD